MRFQDFDAMARLAVVGSLAAALSFGLPWVEVRFTPLQGVEFSGVAMVVAPLLLERIGTPGGLAAGLLVALAAAVALIGAMASLLLILAPGFSTLRELNRTAGRRLCAVGLGAAVVALGGMAAWLGPQVGATVVQYGAAVALLGFALALYAWPKARRLGDDEEAHAPPPPAPPAPPQPPGDA